DHGLELLQMEEAFGLPALVIPRVKVPVIVRLHGPWFLNGPAVGVPDDSGFKRRVRLERAAIAAAAGVTAPSKDVLDRVRKYYGLALTDAAVIPNPIQTIAASERWSPEGCDRNRILFIGRFDRHKGADVMVEAFVAVLRGRP